MKEMKNANFIMTILSFFLILAYKKSTREASESVGRRLGLRLTFIVLSEINFLINSYKQFNFNYLFE